MTLTLATFASPGQIDASDDPVPDMHRHRDRVAAIVGATTRLIVVSAEIGVARAVSAFSGIGEDLVKLYRISRQYIARPRAAAQARENGCSFLWRAKSEIGAPRRGAQHIDPESERRIENVIEIRNGPIGHTITTI